MNGLLQVLQFAAEMAGTVAFAISGAMLAIDRELDLFGVLFVGIVAAVGGGILRDLMLGITPPNAFIHGIYAFVAFLSSLLIFLYGYISGKTYSKKRNSIDHAVNFMDAVGLGIFTVIGMQTAMDKGYADNMFLCVTMGMVTGTGGGMIRDMLCEIVPAILHKRIYAVASIAGGCAFYLMLNNGVPGPVSMIVSIVIIMALRMLATHFMWDLPIVRKEDT